MLSFTTNSFYNIYSDTFSITGPMGGTPIICGSNEVSYMLEVILISSTMELVK